MPVTVFLTANRVSLTMKARRRMMLMNGRNGMRSLPTNGSDTSMRASVRGSKETASSPCSTLTGHN